MTIEMTYTFFLRPQKTGTLTIGPATIDYDTRKTESKEISIEVSEGQVRSSAQSNQAREEAFLKITTSKNEVYVGEPVMVDYWIYYREIDNPKDLEFPEFRGFYTKRIELDEKEQFGSEVIGGKRYNTANLGRFVLIPQLASASIEGELKAVIPTVVRSRRRDVFGRFLADIVNINARARVPNIEVKPLPTQGKPHYFTGGVGSFDIKANLSASEVEANESVTLEIELSGSGNLRMVEMPKPEIAGEIEAFDAEVSDDIRTGSLGKRGSRISEILLVPRYKGQYKIPSMKFAYFNLKEEVS
jgi:hypothetical protein